MGYFDTLEDIAALASSEKVYDCLLDTKKQQDAEDRKDDLRKLATEKLRDAFARHDKDNSGTLDAEEAQAFFGHYVDLNAQFQKKVGAATIVANMNGKKLLDGMAPKAYTGRYRKMFEASDHAFSKATRMGNTVKDI